MAGNSIWAGNSGAEARRHVVEGVDMRRVLQHFIGWRNIILYLLLLTSLCTVAYGLSKSVLNISFSTMSILAILGVSYSWLCAITRLKDWHVAFLTLLLGITASVYFFAHLTRPMIALFNAIESVVGEVFSGSTKGSPDVSSIYFALQQITAQLGTLFNRIILLVDNLTAAQVGHDAMISSMLWGLAFWLTAIWAGWLLFRRHSAIASIIPATVMLAGSLNYIAAIPLYLVPLIGTTLTLQAVTSYDRQELFWVNHHIDFAEDIRFDLNMVVPLLAFGFMLISVFAPSVSIQQIINASQKVTQRYQVHVDSIAKSLGLKPQSQGLNTFNTLRNPGLPRSHLLGSGPDISKDVVMVIGTGDYPPTPSIASLPAELIHYYWRSLTYDIYTGHGWETSSIDMTSYSSNQPAIEGVFPITGTIRLVHQSFQLTQDLGGLIYSAGQLISVDKDYQVAWRLSPTDNSDDSQDQIADEFGATFEGGSYKVDSFINTVSLTRLRSASGEIPLWIKDRYLALPENLPTRVRQLTIDLTRDHLTEYDQATAIEAYLRTFTYTLDLPLPPPDRDVVDYFLFDLKRGYCDYYASAMVVMARSIGLPARLVTGYSSGIYDPVNAYYVVTETNAHSWVEVYIGGTGWQEFEPTASLPSIRRPDDQVGNIEIPQIKPVQHFNLIRWLNSINHHWLVIFSGMFGTLFLGIFLWVFSEQWRLYRLTPSVTIVKLYQRLYHNGQPIAEGVHTGDTPFEFADHLEQRMIMLAKPHRSNYYFQRSVEEITRLTTLYTQVVYSPHTPELSDQKTAIHIWIHLRRRLWLAAKLEVLKRMSSKKKPNHE